VKVEIGLATVRIYALCDYPSWEPRYVGKTIQRMDDRHKAHIRDAKRGSKRPVGRWIRKKLANGERLVIKLLEWASTDNWAERERYWIAKFRDSGRLLNLTDGGEGLHGHKFSPEHRQKIRSALRAGAEFACETCGTKFWRKPKDIKAGNCRFCSRACYSASLVGVSRPVSKLCVERGVAAAAAAKRAKEHCKRGHSLSGDNVYINPRGVRICRECRKLHKKASLERANG
jgi:hypothetical protein